MAEVVILSGGSVTQWVPGRICYSGQFSQQTLRFAHGPQGWTSESPAKVAPTQHS